MSDARPCTRLRTQVVLVIFIPGLSPRRGCEPPKTSRRDRPPYRPAGGINRGCARNKAAAGALTTCLRLSALIISIFNNLISKSGQGVSYREIEARFRVR
jgi:hypothetical protein